MAELVTVTENDDGQRLDRWLRKYYPDLSFVYAQKLLRTGQVRVDGKRAKGNARLAAGQQVRIPPQVTADPQSDRPLSQKDIDFIRSLVIYQDDHIMALNKPAGLATQGGTNIRKHIDGLLDGLAVNDVRPHLVHRLDKETSGILLLARSADMARQLGRIFKSRDIRKYYWAVTTPSPVIHQGVVDAPLEKLPSGRDGRPAVKVDWDEGKPAQTIYSVMEDMGGKAAWVAFWPRTGRMHQIRVHAAEINAPVLGDARYAPAQEFLDANPELPRSLHLHARRIIFPHPVTQKTIDIVAPIEQDMATTFKFFGFDSRDISDPFAEIEI